MITIEYRSDYEELFASGGDFDCYYDDFKTQWDTVAEDSRIFVRKLAAYRGELQEFLRFIRNIAAKGTDITLIMPIINGEKVNGVSCRLYAHLIYEDGKLIKDKTTAEPKEKEMKNFDDFVKKGDKYEVNSTFKVAIGKPGMVSNTDNMIIPEGFQFDVSVPKLVRPLFDNQPTRVAAMIHDRLIERQYNPKFRDQVFYDALKECGASLPYRILCWSGVRIYSIVTGMRIV